LEFGVYLGFGFWNFAHGMENLMRQPCAVFMVLDARGFNGGEDGKEVVVASLRHVTLR
jgi:hypothetical protein